MKKFFFMALAAVIFYSVSAMAKTCVENNTTRCDKLGYTASSCPYGGIACPFDTSKWHCAKWTCADGRYSSSKTSDSCVKVTYKGLNCYDCHQ